MKSCDFLIVLLQILMFRFICISLDCFGNVELAVISTWIYCQNDKSIISMFSFTLVSLIYLEFSRYLKYSPSAKLQGTERFFPKGSLKSALPMLNCFKTLSSSMPVLVTTQKPTRVTASWSSLTSSCFPPDSPKRDKSILTSGV